MQQPARVDLAGDRYVPFIETIPVLEEDFTGATFKMQVRDRKDGGALRADLSTVGSMASEGVTLVYAGTDTVANHIAASRLDQDEADALGLAGTDNLTMSVLGVRINETTMEAMPEPGVIAAGEIGDDLSLVYDMHITPSGGNKDLWFGGAFLVRAGSTQ
jgi:hypothetical protein